MRQVCRGKVGAWCAVVVGDQSPASGVWLCAPRSCVHLLRPHAAGSRVVALRVPAALVSSTRPRTCGRPLPMRVAGIGLCAHVSMMGFFLLDTTLPIMGGTPRACCRHPCRRSTGPGGRFSRQPTVRCTCLSSWHAACAAFALRRSTPANCSLMKPRVPYLYVIACTFRCWFVWVPPSSNVVHAAGLDTSPHMVAQLHVVFFSC
jgi:hypothetical protein